MNFDSIITIAAFGVYLIFMICIGMYFMGKSRTTTDYFLGGSAARRRTAQASTSKRSR